MMPLLIDNRNKSKSALFEKPFGYPCTPESDEDGPNRRNPGAAEDGSAKVLVVAPVIFHACPCVKREGQARKGRQGVVEDVPQDVAQDLAFGARTARALFTTTAVFVQLALRYGRNWAAQWHLARAVGKRFKGCRAKHF